jgi:hypothetical protein
MIMAMPNTRPTPARMPKTISMGCFLPAIAYKVDLSRTFSIFEGLRQKNCMEP